MKRLLVLASGLCSIVFVVIVIGSYVIVAQTAITGEWRSDARAEKQEKDGNIHLSFARSTGKGHQNQFGSSFAFDDLQGLTREHPNVKVEEMVQMKIGVRRMKDNN